METTQTMTQPTSGFKKLLEQFAKFFLVGIMNTAVDLIILNVLTILSGVKDGSGYAVQKSISFLFAVTFSYFINKYWTFQDTSKEAEGKKMSQFFLVSLIGMLINVSAAFVAVTYLKAPINTLLNLPFLTDQVWVTLGGLCGTAAGLLWNFVGYKLWVFRK